LVAAHCPKLHYMWGCLVSVPLYMRDISAIVNLNFKESSVCRINSIMKRRLASINKGF